MIVRDDGASLVLVTQPDHAALARRLMERWVADGLPAHPRRAAILQAIEQHDNGWLEVDAAPIVDGEGRILDFVTAPADVRQGVWPRAVARLEHDPWTAALVAEHAVYVYSRFRADPLWTAFFAGMEARRDAAMLRAGLRLDDLEHDYRWLRLADLVSLVFCARWTDTHEAFGYSIRGEEGDVLITPDPFGGRHVPLTVAARVLPKARFEDAADAARCWRNAALVEVQGEVRASG